jgi:hypothetical protein
MFSQWHKIDLHIHTDKSNETKNNDYHGIFNVGVLIDKLRENSVGMVSLTDHNIINCEAYDVFFKQAEIKALVGVELDIAITEEELQNYIFALAGKKNDKIEVKPFHVIVIFESENYNQLNDLLDKMFEDISTHLLDSTINLNSQKTLRATSFRYLVETFHEHNFFIIAHGDKSKGIIPPYSKTGSLPDAQYNILMGEISALEMKSNIKMNNVIEIYKEGFSSFLKEGFKETPSSYVVFSDNHHCEQYICPDLCTWMKGHLNYETLRICFSDPESRIHTADRQPTSTVHYLDSIKLSNNKDLMNELSFSPHLNVIIGGRSSGKSLLFNTLVNLNTSLPAEDKEVFENNYQGLVNLEESRIKTNLGPFETNIALDAEVYCQEKIIELFKDDKSLKDKLKDYFPNFDAEEVDAEENKVKQLFNRFKAAYRDYYEACQNIEKQDRLSIIAKSIQKTNKIFEIQSKNLSVEFDIAHHNEVSEKLTNAGTVVQETKNLKFKGNDFFSEAEQDSIDRIVSFYQNKVDLVNRSKLKTDLQLQFFDNVRIINDGYVKQELTQEIQQIEAAKELLNKDIDDYRDYFRTKLSLKKVCEEIENINVEIEDKKVETNKYIFITKLNLKINTEIIQKYLCDFIFHYDPGKSIYANMLDMADHQQEVRVKQKTGRQGKLPDSLNKKIDEFVDDNKSKINHEIIEKGTMPISTDSTSQGRKASIFLDVKLDSFAESPRTVVLMIDQIEDNIDNKYISKDLVDSLRHLKKFMQIILVTHNPSIAVYGDAENIIICDNKDGVISYKQGGLENIEIRNEACQILDGGDIAFKNRMDKYNIVKFKAEI